MTDNSQVLAILATDCGSTTTKAILIERQGAEYRLTTRRGPDHGGSEGG